MLLTMYFRKRRSVVLSSRYYRLGNLNNAKCPGAHVGKFAGGTDRTCRQLGKKKRNTHGAVLGLRDPGLNTRGRTSKARAIGANLRLEPPRLGLSRPGPRPTGSHAGLGLSSA